MVFSFIIILLCLTILLATITMLFDDMAVKNMYENIKQKESIKKYFVNQHNTTMSDFDAKLISYLETKYKIMLHNGGENE